MLETTEIKNFYTTYHDTMLAKRLNSPFPVRRAVHQDIFQSILRHIPSTGTVLDAGCGEGGLSHLMSLLISPPVSPPLSPQMSSKGGQVVGLDISEANLESARRNFPTVQFIKGDLEQLPFEDKSFDTVVSNHVLEHLPNFDQGLTEVLRVARKQALIAVPTNLSPLSWSLLGGGQYWQVGKKSLYSLPWGLAKVFTSLVLGQEGVNEGYGGQKNIPHIHRFPWVVSQKLRKLGFNNFRIEAQTLRLPYLNFNFSSNWPQQTFPTKYLGLGTLYIVSVGQKK